VSLDPMHQELLDLILDVSFERRKVILASGRESDFYLDLRQTLMRPKGVDLAGRLMLEALKRGPAVIRKQAKQHGLGKRIEGGFAEGQTVALVEDTTTTGGSTLDAVDAVQEAGGKVARVLCLVDRGEGAMEAFAERGLTLEPLFGRAHLPV